MYITYVQCKCERTYTHTQTHASLHTHSHACMHAHTHTHTHTHTRTHTHTHTSLHTHSHTLTHTHTHTHTLANSPGLHKYIACISPSSMLCRGSLSGEKSWSSFLVAAKLEGRDSESWVRHSYNTTSLYTGNPIHQTAYHTPYQYTHAHSCSRVDSSTPRKQTTSRAIQHSCM